MTLTGRGSEPGEAAAAAAAAAGAGAGAAGALPAAVAGDEALVLDARLVGGAELDTEADRETGYTRNRTERR